MNSVNKSEDFSSNCTVCGESFLTNGNFCFKVLPSKRIPKKAIRLRKNLLSMSSVSPSSSALDTMWGLTKFQKYLLKRSVPKNYCELKCKNCNTVSKLPLTKPTKKSSTTPYSQTKTPSSCRNSDSFLDSGGGDDEGKRKRKKKKKEVNAGLIIPESFRPSSTTLLAQKVSNTNKTTATTKSQNVSTPLNPTAFRNLQKALFKSKTMDSTSASSDLTKLLQ